MITKFVLKNLHCDACGKVSQMKIKKIQGVTSVQINQEGHEAAGELEADQEINVAEIQGALSDTEYKVFAA
jgi:copper chaperone CopZ